MIEKISKHLQLISEIINMHHVEMGLDPEKALSETLKLTKEIGKAFNHETVYLSYNGQMNKKMQTVKKLYLKGIKNHTEISKITGIPRSTVTYYIIRMNIS